MPTRQKIYAFFIAALLVLTLCAGTGYAQPDRGADIRIQADPGTVEAGKTFTVTVKFTGTGDTIGTLQASIRYDADMMAYKSGGGNAVELGNGSGGISDTGSETAKSISYTLNFLALKAGTAHFSVSSSEVIGYTSSSKLGNPRGETEITITNAPPAASTAPDPMEITMDGKTYYLQQDIASIELPDGYLAEKYFFNGQEVQIAFNTANGVTLLYLTDETGSEGFYVYDIPARTVYPYITVQTPVGGYTVLPAEGTAPEGYEPAQVVIGSHTANGWKRKGGDTAFYILYARNVQGEAGYYIYDKAEGTLQRAAVRSLPTSNPAQAETPITSGEQGTYLWAVYTLGAAAVVMILITILLGIRAKRNRHAHKDQHAIF